MAANQSKTAQEKPLQGMFSDIPPHYDLINTFITCNLDKGWRRMAAKACLGSKPQRVLDLCCGTGDLAMDIARIDSSNIEIKGLDYSQPMLDIARQKLKKLRDPKNIDFIQGDVSQLPFQENYFDSLGISFAFRNLTYKNPLAARHLSEIIRVIKPGGRCIIAESSQPDSRIIRSLYHLYMRTYAKWIGSWISGNKPAYNYLAESTSRFYSSNEIEKLLLNCGFKSISYQPLLFGAAGIYTATK